MFSFQIFCTKNFSTNRASNKNISNFIQQLRNLAYYPKREPVVCFEKKHVYVNKVSCCDKGEMKDS